MRKRKLEKHPLKIKRSLPPTLPLLVQTLANKQRGAAGRPARWILGGCTFLLVLSFSLVDSPLLLLVEASPVGDVADGGKKQRLA